MEWGGWVSLGSAGNYPRTTNFAIVVEFPTVWFSFTVRENAAPNPKDFVALER
jgi:hypothetical protein